MTSPSGPDGRPPIPADVRRRVLVEAGHRCAIPACRHIEVDLHHIVPWAQCQAHEYENLIALCPNCHRRADRGDIDRKSLRLYKANLRFAHDKFSHLEMDTLFELYRMPANQGMAWLGFMLFLLRRLIDAGYIEVHPLNFGMSIGTAGGAMKTTPDAIAITEKGRAFIDDLGVAEL
jgi:hypothetical protein